MKNQISYKLAIAKMYMHGYEISSRVYNNMCVHHFNAKTPDEQDRLGKIVKEQADICHKYEKKLKPIMFALAHAGRHMSRPQRRELNLLRGRCQEAWLSEVKEKTKINILSLVMDTFDDLDLPDDDFDRMEDYYESQADYSEDNPQNYEDEIF